MILLRVYLALTYQFIGEIKRLVTLTPTMKPRPPWLGKYDEPILEFYAESEMAAPPAVVRFNLDWKGVASPAHSTVKRRVKKLAEHELLEKVDENAGYYAISEKGREYLAGELDAEQLEPDGE